MIGKAASIFVQFLGVIFVARILGATSFGILSIAYIPISLAAILMNTGINPALIKYLSQYRLDDKPQHRRTLIETGAAINFTAGTILTLITHLSSPFIAETIFGQPELIPLIRLYSLILIGQTLVNTANSVLVGYERMELRSAVDIIYSLLRSIAGPVLVYLGWGALGAVSGNVASQLVAGLVGFIMVVAIWRSEPERLDGFTHLECAKLMLVYGYPLFLSSLIGGVTPNITSFLLAMYVSPEYIGNYQAATRFGVLVTFFTVPIATVMFPLFSKLEKQVDALRAVFVNSVKYVGLIIYPIIAAIIILAPQIVSVLYGQGYPYADNYLRLYMFTFLAYGLGMVGVGSLLAATGNTRVYFYDVLINSVVTLSLGVMLIPRHGVPGLIISSIIGSLLGFIYGLHWIRKNLDITPDYVTALKTILAAASAGFATHLYANTVQLNPWTELLTGGALCILIYIASVLILGALKQEDLDNLENISRGLGPIYPIIKKIYTLIRPLFKP